MLMVHIFTIYTTYVVVWTVQAQTAIQHLDQFKRNTQLDGKLCKGSDAVFQGISALLADCAGRCRTTVGCSGIMYNRMKSSCVGCRGKYTNETILSSEADTQYFAGDWIDFEGNFFKHSTTKTMTFNDAKEYCRLNGGVLPRVDSDAKRLFLLTTFGSFIGGFWVGLTDEGHEGTWTWLNDGTEATFTSWNTVQSQPDGSGNCARTNVNFYYRWGDASCSELNHVICERRWVK